MRLCSQKLTSEVTLIELCLPDNYITLHATYGITAYVNIYCCSFDA